jgi:DNA-binding response OmpR family regulator
MSVLDEVGVRLYPSLYLVVRAGLEVQLSPMQFRMLEMIAADPIGITPAMLFDRLYIGADTPLTGARSVHIQRVHANKKLRAIRVRIETSRRNGGPGSLYRLVAA